jgi:type IV pilus assembly protein PilB
LNERIGELLVKENLLSAEQLLKAREEAATKGRRLGAQITELGFLDENELTEFVAKQYGVPSINLEDFAIESDVIALIPEEVANKHNVVPVNRAGSTLILATADPSNIFALDDIKFLTGYNIQPVVASEEAIRNAIESYYAEPEEDLLDEVMADFDDEGIDFVSGEDEEDSKALAKEAEDAPVVKLVNLILTDAKERDHLAHQDHVGARHRRAPAAPGRPHQAQARQGPRDGFSCLGPAHALRREGRPSSPRQEQSAARHD